MKITYHAATLARATTRRLILGALRLPHEGPMAPAWAALRSARLAQGKDRARIARESAARSEMWETAGALRQGVGGRPRG